MTDEPRDNGAHEDALESSAMPVIPDELGIDPMLSALLHCAAFLDLSDENTVDPEAAHGVLEYVGLYVQRLSPERIAALESELDRLRRFGEQSNWPEWVVAFVADFLYSCGIGEDEDEAEHEEDDEDEGE
jgi:hypothetical protein